MKRLGAVLGLTAAATLLSMGPASADPSVCISLDLSVNGEGTAQNICLPPA